MNYEDMKPALEWYTDGKDTLLLLEDFTLWKLNETGTGWEEIPGEK